MIEDLSDLEGFHIEEEDELSDKPWKDGKHRKNRTKKHNSPDWEEVQRARARYIKDWEEELKYAKELAEDGMHG